MPLSTSTDLKTDYDVIIVGGGLAGLTSAILLASKRKKILLIEKKTYPFHKVCGEYISNEVLPFLQSIGFNPHDYGAAKINQLRISTPSGKSIMSLLDMGGFGLSRYTMDNALARLAIENGAEVITNTKVNDITFEENFFKIKTNTGNSYSAKLVLGTYGKRDMLDKKLSRNFINSHTGYMGVKYHVKTDYPVNEVGLDNFKNGYCGIVKIEKDTYNICYLYKRQPDYSFQSIRELEENVLYKNPIIKNIFTTAQFLNAQPEVINEISFVRKKLIENHIIMCGDAAGLIAPLCGNGMSMAIHAAKLLSQLILDAQILDRQIITIAQRKAVEDHYLTLWQQNFSSRLFWGRSLQRIFGHPVLTELSINTIHSIPKLEQWLIKKTHGKLLESNENL